MSQQCCWHYVYLWPNTARACSQWGWKVSASSHLASLSPIRLFSCASRAKRRGPNIYPLTQAVLWLILLIGQGTEGEADGWKTTRQWGSEGGATDTVGFGGREWEKTRIVCLPETTEEKRNASQKMSHYCQQPTHSLFSHDQTRGQRKAYYDGTFQWSHIIQTVNNSAFSRMPLALTQAQWDTMFLRFLHKTGRTLTLCLGTLDLRRCCSKHNITKEDWFAFQEFLSFLSPC